MCNRRGQTQCDLCREYNIAIRTELARKEEKDDPVRAAELAAYLTHVKLQPKHQMLILKSAMGIFWKAKNLATCVTFAQRLVELNAPGQVWSSAPG